MVYVSDESKTAWSASTINWHVYIFDAAKLVEHAKQGIPRNLEVYIMNEQLGECP